MKKAALQPQVAVLLGSDDDWETVSETVKMLAEFGVETEVQVISPYRTPERASEFARKAKSRGIKIIIAATGSAAHLAGAVAAHTTLPVIGVPIKSEVLDGLDALLSAVQMPAGVPVATVALGKAGAINAALLAIQILALGRPDLQKKLEKYKSTLKQKVEEDNVRLHSKQVTR